MFFVIFIFVLFQAVLSISDPIVIANFQQNSPKSDHRTEGYKSFKEFQYMKNHWNSSVYRSHKKNIYHTLLNNPAQCAQWQAGHYLYACLVSFCHAVSVYENERKTGGILLYTNNTHRFYIKQEDLNNILHTMKLYEYEQFWLFLQSLPCYEDCILQIRNKVMFDQKIAKKISKKLLDKINQEHLKIKANKSRLKRQSSYKKKLSEEMLLS